jgi:hypothetical protein
MNLWSYLKASPILIPFFIGIYKYKELRNLKFLFFFICGGVVTETGLKILKSIGYRNNLVLTHFYAIASFVLLAIFFQKVFSGYIKRIWFKSLIFFFLILCFVQLLFFQSINDFPSLQFSVLALVMVAFSILYFHKVMVEAKIVHLSKEPLIWINAAILVYYTGSLFYYILFNLFLDQLIDFFFTTMRYYFPALNALFYVLIAVGFWKTSNSKTV